MLKPVRKINWMEMSGLLVGVFITFALMVFLFVFYARLTSAGVIGVEEYKLYSFFEKAQGLHPGTEVQINGVRVGQVSNLNIDASGLVRMEFTIRKEFQPWITDKAMIFAIRDQNVISERVVNIDVRKGEGRVLEDGDMITGGKAQDIETVLETLNEVLERVTVLIDAADTLVALTMDTNTTIGALLGSKLVYEKLNTQLDRLDYFSYEGIRLLDVLSGEVPRILYRTDSLTQKLFSMTNEMENVPQKIDNAFLSLDRFFGQMNGAMDSLNRMVGGVNGLVSQGEETLLNADNLIEGASNMWIIRRSLPKRDSVPFVAEDVW
ncbi:phospholipid/cholesterol/gamma-HCH transport system substrate-binding protein [Fibrobacter intestinalis]|uniref:Phospholipid/cholesterol/gamma-HCH transport system substrate-binding protein n=3 Tax=Fibrobacter intestinalis TaxID=28122 RepID=A0A1M6YPV9_9BACT|nr:MULTISPECIES: MlaD family protein [unclassified Fibrobacter]PBC66773.1 phospholipid/cholesterol/gamma-HCH transport system substrate-binding protein [Fibrobacter sp. UWS1]PBC75168.1 phospholipid/cholesterol/gamma-HCH transport system substrate-binding protein [Fibrobacter sp. NR9]SHL20361.1 phospholipid/cholesterol/gamma-HCH transport system substrate-binding protein [Fibrobacter intestinalis]SJZ75549.1 phospholipid/cholesterol/gamma-HCH transport system substrate-binding protein [Fibrobacte